MTDEPRPYRRYSCFIRFLIMLTVFFVGLKVTGIYDGSWWWVFSPMLTYATIVSISEARRK